MMADQCLERTDRNHHTGTEQSCIHQKNQEKVVIPLSDSAIVTSIPDTTLLIDALNSGRIDSFAPRLAPDVAIRSEDTRKVIEGRAQALGYLTSQIEDLNGCALAGHLAAPVRSIRRPSGTRRSCRP
jgi:hypothetical protein